MDCRPQWKNQYGAAFFRNARRLDRLPAKKRATLEPRMRADAAAWSLAAKGLIDDGLLSLDSRVCPTSVGAVGARLGHLVVIDWAIQNGADPLPLCDVAIRFRRRELVLLLKETIIKRAYQGIDARGIILAAARWGDAATVRWGLRLQPDAFIGYTGPAAHLDVYFTTVVLVAAARTFRPTHRHLLEFLADHIARDWSVGQPMLAPASTTLSTSLPRLYGEVLNSLLIHNPSVDALDWCLAQGAKASSADISAYIRQGGCCLRIFSWARRHSLIGPEERYFWGELLRTCQDCKNEKAAAALKALC